MEQLRERFASTNPVERAAADGDVVTIDLQAKVDGEVLEDGVADGVSYTIGSGELLDGIDEAVTGLEAGGEATFTSQLKGGSAEGKDAEVTVKVTAVAARELPELDDDFAQMASEFDTLEELKADSRKRLETTKQYDQATQAQERVLEELLKLAEVPIPEKLLADEVQTRKHNLEHHQLGQMGLDLEKYLEIQGKTLEEFENETSEQAIKGIKTQFILDELVNKEKLNVNQEELTEHTHAACRLLRYEPRPVRPGRRRGWPGADARRRGRPRQGVSPSSSRPPRSSTPTVRSSTWRTTRTRPPSPRRRPGAATERRRTTRPRRRTRPEPRSAPRQPRADRHDGPRTHRVFGARRRSAPDRRAPRNPCAHCGACAPSEQLRKRDGVVPPAR